MVAESRLLDILHLLKGNPPNQWEWDTELASLQARHQGSQLSHFIKGKVRNWSRSDMLLWPTVKANARIMPDHCSYHGLALKYDIKVGRQRPSTAIATGTRRHWPNKRGPPCLKGVFYQKKKKVDGFSFMTLKLEYLPLQYNIEFVVCIITFLKKIKNKYVKQFK